MKRHILLWTLVLATTNCIKAQGVDLGIKAGANFADISDIDNASNRTAIVLGGFVGVKFNDKWAIQIDALYSQQGADFEFSDIEIDYINLPVIIKYYLFSGLHLQLGPQFGILVDDNISSSLGNAFSNNEFDFSGVVGVGYDLPFGFRLEGRYNFGLTDIVDSDIGNATDSGRNTIITLSVGYSFL